LDKGFWHGETSKGFISMRGMQIALQGKSRCRKVPGVVQGQ